MRVTGTVRRADVEGGVWTFDGDDGKVYQLRGGGKDLLRNGVRATVDGSIQRDAMGIGMVGPILRVSTYEIEK